MMRVIRVAEVAAQVASQTGNQGADLARTQEASEMAIIAHGSNVISARVPCVAASRLLAMHAVCTQHRVAIVNTIRVMTRTYINVFVASPLG